MRILLGDELLEFDQETLDYMFLDEGNESEVFRYGDSVLKIYKDYCVKDRLGEDDVIYLSKIPTKRILMPREVIRDADTMEFMGYSMPFIYKYPRDVLMRIKMNHFLDELDVIHSDLELLSEHHVDVEDIHIDNVLYNESFFIGDPGSFEIQRDTPVGRIYRNNVYTFKVAKSATKDEIKFAVEEAFKVSVKKVNTLNTKAKRRRVGKYAGKTKTYKKAYITLADGEKIEL